MKKNMSNILHFIRISICFFDFYNLFIQYQFIIYVFQLRRMDYFWIKVYLMLNVGIFAYARNLRSTDPGKLSFIREAAKNFLFLMEVSLRKK